MAKILLFDIDGTLLEGGREYDRPHFEAYDDAFRTVYNVPSASVDEITPHGMIDTQVIVEVLQRHHVTAERAWARMAEAVQAMERYFMAHHRQGRYVALPGVRDLLATLRHKRVPLGLLTGNIEHIAWTKLERAGLREYFSFGAFGDMATTRAELIPLAVRRYQEQGQLPVCQADVVLIGDSPLDVACAKAGGVPIIAVASANYASTDLRDVGADLVVSSLEQRQLIFAYLSIR